MGWVIHKVRSMLWTTFYRCLSFAFFESFGKGVIIEGWIDLPQRGGLIMIGDYVRVCRNVEFSVPKGGKLILKNGCMIGRGVLLSAHKMIIIGQGAMLAEYVCAHDNNHIFDSINVDIHRQGFESKELSVGDDCWIGAHSILVCGATVSCGVVVGANSLLNNFVPEYSVVAGSPAKIIRSRIKS